MKRQARSEAIRVAVVGYGGSYNMGKIHLEQMRQAGMTPAAVADTAPDRLEEARRDFPGIETHTSVAAMLRRSKPDLVAIITPHNSHARLAIQCLEAGSHVVCEKPMAVTTAECDAMIRAARKRKRMLSAYHNRHWDGCILEAMDRIVTRGDIGEVVRIEAHIGEYTAPRAWWRASKSISGGILLDWGVHLIEYALQIVRSDVVEVTGFAHQGFWASKSPWKADTNEDEASAIVRMRNGVWINLRISAIDAAPPARKLAIWGTRGQYAFDHSGYDWVRVENGQTIRVTGANRKNEGERYYQNVADHLSRCKPLVITAEWARRTIHILDLAARGARAGKTLRARYG